MPGDDPTMGVIKHRSLDRPDLTRQFTLGLGEITRLGSLAIGRAGLEPGWQQNLAKLDRLLAGP